MQLDLQRPGEQHVAGHADHDRLGADARERVAHRLRVGHRSAIDRFAQQQERLDRKALGESPAMMIEIFGHRRTIESRQQLSESRVQLVAAAIGEHAQLARPHHAGGDVAVAQAITHQLALQMARGRAPAVGAQPGRDGDQLRAAIGMTGREHHADHAAEARADPGDGKLAPAAVEPCRDEVGEAGDRNGVVRVAGRQSPATSSRCRARMGRARCAWRDRSGPARRAPATMPRADRHRRSGRRRTETGRR